MKNEWLRPLGFFFVFGFLGVLLYATLPRLLGTASGVENEVVVAIKDAERAGLSLTVFDGGQPLQGTKRARFDRITVTVAPDGQHAVAVSTLDFDGKLGATKVSSLGLESVSLQKIDGEWVAPGGMAPRLAAIVRALELRRRALEAANEKAAATLTADGGFGDSAEVARIFAMRDRKLQVRAWLIRSERDEVMVTEESLLEGTTPDRPIHEERVKRLRLSPRTDGGEFCFPEGLM